MFKVNIDKPVQGVRCMRHFIAVLLLILLALGGPVVAENLVKDMKTLKKGVGVSFDLAAVPEKGATISFNYYLAPRVV